MSVTRGLGVARSALAASLFIVLVACSAGTQFAQTSGSNTRTGHVYDAQKAAAQDPQNDTGFFHEISGLGD